MTSYQCAGKKNFSQSLTKLGYIMHSCRISGHRRTAPPITHDHKNDVVTLHLPMKTESVANDSVKVVLVVDYGYESCSCDGGH